MAEKIDIYDLVLAHARPLMLTRFRADSCVAGARIVIDALGYFGIHAEPRPVLAFIINNEARAMAEAGASLPEVYAEALKYELADPGGPWTLGLGVDDGTPDGAGHVVVYVPEIDSFLDITIDQANRPTKHLHFGPLMLGGDPVDRLPFEIPQDDGTAVIIYTPEEQRYKKSPNWRGVSLGSKEPFKDVTGRLIRVMKEQLA